MLHVVGYYYRKQLETNFFSISIKTQKNNWVSKNIKKPNILKYKLYFDSYSDSDIEIVPQLTFLSPNGRRIASCGESCLMNIFNSFFCLAQ